MKKINLFALLTILLFAFTFPLQAQNSRVKQEVKKKMKDKYAEPQKEKAREKGREAVKDVTYENDKRYTNPKNKVKATLVMKTSIYKKNGKLKNSMNSKIVFGNTGECMIMNEGEKNESRLLFDYKGAATYMVDTKNKTAMKMPMINFKKIMERMAKNQVDLDDSNGEWKRTDEQKMMNGYNCRKYVYTNTKENAKMDLWVTQDISIDLSGNHLMGGKIRDFSTDPIATKGAKTDKNTPKGVVIRSVQYTNNSKNPSSQMDITTFKKSADPNYFDLSDYKINDVLNGL